MHKVLKAFPYSHDGLKVEALSAGAEADIRADLVSGLEEAGFIRPVDAKAPPVNFQTDFDPATAEETALRAFLEAHGEKPHHKTGEAKLREMAAEILTKG